MQVTASAVSNGHSQSYFTSFPQVRSALYIHFPIHGVINHVIDYTLDLELLAHNCYFDQKNYSLYEQKVVDVVKVEYAVMSDAIELIQNRTQAKLSKALKSQEQMFGEKNVVILNENPACGMKFVNSLKDRIKYDSFANIKFHKIEILEALALDFDDTPLDLPFPVPELLPIAKLFKDFRMTLESDAKDRDQEITKIVSAIPKESFKHGLLLIQYITSGRDSIKNTVTRDKKTTAAQVALEALLTLCSTPQQRGQLLLHSYYAYFAVRNDNNNKQKILAFMGRVLQIGVDPHAAINDQGRSLYDIVQDDQYIDMTELQNLLNVRKAAPDAPRPKFLGTPPDQHKVPEVSCKLTIKRKIN